MAMKRWHAVALVVSIGIVGAIIYHLRKPKKPTKAPKKEVPETEPQKIIKLDMRKEEIKPKEKPKPQRVKIIVYKYDKVAWTRIFELPKERYVMQGYERGLNKMNLRYEKVIL